MYYPIISVSQQENYIRSPCIIVLFLYLNRRMILGLRVLSYYSVSKQENDIRSPCIIALFLYLNRRMILGLRVLSHYSCILTGE